MKYRKRENEKGVALLLALGFAALLLVLVLGFTTNALIERKVASNNGDKTQARAIAKSAVNRAVVAMKYRMQAYPEDAGVQRFDNIVSKHEDNGNPISDNDLNSVFRKLTTGGGSDRYLFQYRNNIFIYEYPKEDNIDYNYNGATVNSSINNMRRPQWQLVTDDTKSPSPVIGRFMYAVLPDIGRIPRMNKNAPIKGSSIYEFDIEQISSDLEVDDDSSFAHITAWSSNVLEDTSLERDKQPFRTRAFYVINSIESDESTSDLNTHFSNSATDDTMVDIIDWDSDYTKPEKLAEVLDLSTGGIVGSEEQEKIVAANIIGAFYENADAGNISNSTDWINTPPTYTGNKITPYLNEVEISIPEITGTPTSLGDTDSNGIDEFSVTPKAKVRIQVELRNFFGSTGSHEATVKINGGKIKFSNGHEVALENAELTSSATGDYPILSYEKEYEGTAISGSSGFVVSAEITGLDINVVYKNGGEYADYVKNLTQANPCKTETEAVSSTAALITKTPTLISFEAKDALCNFDASSWTESNASTIGAINSNDVLKDNIPFTAALTAKSKYITDPTNNDPTLADLRFVSTGAVGKTFDLIGNANDRKILDRLTTMQDDDPQLIDINTRSVGIWRGLLSGVKKADESADIIANQTDIENIAKAISEKLMDPSTTAMKNRSDLIPIISEAYGETSGLASDDSPILIGKIMPLCKVEPYPEFIYMIVVAQTVKDNMGGPDFGDVGDFEEEHDEIIAEVKYLVKLHREYNGTKHEIKVISMEELTD